MMFLLHRVLLVLKQGVGAERDKAHSSQVSRVVAPGAGSGRAAPGVVLCACACARPGPAACLYVRGDSECLATQKCLEVSRNEVELTVFRARSGTGAGLHFLTTFWVSGREQTRLCVDDDAIKSTWWPPLTAVPDS